MEESKVVTLRTMRLELKAATFDHICAEMESPEKLARLLETRVETGWPPGEYDRAAQEFFGYRLKEGGISVAGWYLWYAIRQEEGRASILIGAGGYLGPPDDEGAVEIGFSVMPSWRKYGYATEMARAFVEHAFGDIRVRKVVARTSPGNVASLRVLAKSGFRPVCRDQASDSDLFEILRT